MRHMSNTVHRYWITEIEPPDISRRDHPELWAESVRLLPDLTDDQRAKVVALVRDTCHSCFAAGDSCQCWNDE